MSYDIYRLSAREWIIIIGEYLLIMSAIAFLFYDSWISLIFISPFFILFVNKETDKKRVKRNEEVDKEFLKALQSVSTSLAAGFSLENAFVEALSDMERMYGNTALIVNELRVINNSVSLGGRIEEALGDFAKRSGNEHIEEFALIFSVAKETGSGLSKVISSCLSIMNMTRDTEEEARILIRGKLYEQKIMSVIPIGIIAYLRASSGGFITVLYHNAVGVIIMTACLILYIASTYISERICDIKV